MQEKRKPPDDSSATKIEYQNPYLYPYFRIKAGRFQVSELEILRLNPVGYFITGDWMVILFYIYQNASFQLY